jgi:hypothetical protein
MVVSRTDWSAGLSQSIVVCCCCSIMRVAARSVRRFGSSVARANAWLWLHASASTPFIKITRARV